MKKITDFIVEKKYYILVTFIIISLISLFVSTKVNINNDIIKYLPDTSETKIGMNIMNDNFDSIKSSQLYIMFKNLKENEKATLKKELSAINNVSSVDYDTSNKYNNKEYSLFILNVDDYSDSKNAKELYSYIKKEYNDKIIALGGSIDEANKPIVKNWILIAAVLFAMIILIIMCESYIEPFLFLFVIGLAVFLNNGTNIIFDDVSSITSAISAVLQLALSMDYSIILMNRYSQEKEKINDKKIAMKEALYNAFKSITSSSITTIVGLLALVFMSFTIGKDLGLVLAKGVFFSLISIFLCLPALILLFDKAIEKTKKKSFNLKFNKLGKASYKCRYISIIIFSIFFIVSFYLKGNLHYLYTGAEQDEIAKHFNTNNQMVIIYNNKHEDIVSKYCKKLENKKIESILCYGNTIGENLKYNEINGKIKDIKSDTNIDEYLIKIIYYYYNNEDIKSTMTFHEFVSFIENNIYNNKEINSKIDSNLKNNINKLKYFTEKNEINKLRNINDISNILGIEKDKVKSLYVLKHKNDINIKISINEFIDFLNKDVIDNKNYKESINNTTKNSIKQLSNFIDKNKITTKLNKVQLASMFNLDEESINKLLMLYYTKFDSGYKVSLSDFLIGIDKSREYLTNQDLSNIEPIILLAKNENNINGTPLSKNYLKNYFNGYDELVDMVYMYNNLLDDYTMSPKEFLDILLTNFTNYIPSENINRLKLVKLVIDDSLNSNKNLYDYKEMSNILGIEESRVLSLYSIIGNTYQYDYKLSPYEFVKFIISNKNNPALSNIPNDVYNKLTLINKVMNGVISNTKYTYNELSNLLNIDKSNLSLLYSLYDITYVNTNYKINLNNFVKFVINDVVTDKKYNDNFDKNSINKLKSINTIIDSTLNNTKYNSKDLKNILINLGSIEQKTIDLVYIYYGSIYNYNNKYELSIQDFINYLNNNIVKNEIFEEFIDDDMKNKIYESKKSVDDAKNLLVSKNYSRAIINTTFDKESEETFDFIKSIKDDLNTNDNEIYIIGDSLMAYEMNGSFDNELNSITLVTMIAIFIIVALTFKSIIIPLILVLIIECSVFITMSILSLSGSSIYFIAILIVQSILMGATIDYAIVYTSYYKEYRLKGNSIIDSLANSYNNSIHTILTSSSILIIVTFIVGLFAEAIAAKICITISKGTLCSTILILFLLPGILASMDKFIIHKKKLKIKS